MHYFYFPGGIKVFFREVFFYFAYLFFQFPLLGFFLGFAGIIILMKKDFKTGIFLVLAIGINALFFIKTTLWNSLGGTKYTFYIPDYVIYSILIGCGFHFFVDQIIVKKKIKLSSNNISFNKYFLLILALIVIIPTTSYNLTPLLLKKMNWDLLHARDIPYRNNNNFFLIPNKRGYNGARKFGIKTFQEVKPNSIIIADHTLMSILRYLQKIDDIRSDVRLVKSYGSSGQPPALRAIINENINKNNIYIADINDPSSYYGYKFIPFDYTFIQAGPIYEIVAK